MLRTSLRSVRAPTGRPIAGASGRQWHVANVSRPATTAIGKRYFADDKRLGSEVPQPAVIPPSETRTATSSQPPPAASQTDVKNATIAPKDVPLTPPQAPDVSATPSPSKAATPPPPPPPPKKKKGFFRRLRNYILTLSILGALTFSGGVWYSRVNDNFHDFFTEYVPYGEQAVLYLEEMDFRKRFPRIAQRGGSGGQGKDTAPNVKVPAQSGASWRVADGPETPGKRQSSAVREAKAKAAITEKPKEEAKAKATDAASSAKDDSENPTVSVVKPPQPLDDPATIAPAPSIIKEPVEELALKSNSKRDSSKTANEAAPAAAAAATEFKPPEVDEPSRWPPASPIDPLAVNDAAEPVVQDLVHMLNDIITVINADGANEKYGPTIGKAKEEANQLGRKIKEMKRGVEDEAAVKIKENIDNLQVYATDLIQRLESHMADQEKRWRQEFEAEMARIREGYDERLKTMTERERQLNEEKLQNRLLEQAIQLQRQFAAEVKAQVESERESRLGRLEALSNAVSELDKLTTGWNEVVDASQRTQQLQVAVDTVRAILDDQQPSASTSTGAQSPKRRFVWEMLAVKETAHGDPVVDAAIASISPAAYQQGISTTPELIDRFRRVATEVRKAALLPSDAGVASHASSWLLSKVMFRKNQNHGGVSSGFAADGNDVESILSRAQTFLEEGDLDSAAREVNGLTGWAKTLSRDWLEEVRKVLEVQQALDVIQTEARLQSLRIK